MEILREFPVKLQKQFLVELLEEILVKLKRLRISGGTVRHIGTIMGIRIGVTARIFGETLEKLVVELLREFPMELHWKLTVELVREFLVDPLEKFLAKLQDETATGIPGK